MAGIGRQHTVPSTASEETNTWREAGLAGNALQPAKHVATIAACLRAEVLVHRVLQAREELIGVLVLPDVHRLPVVVFEGLQQRRGRGGGGGGGGLQVLLPVYAGQMRGAADPSYVSPGSSRTCQKPRGANQGSIPSSRWANMSWRGRSRGGE